MTGPEVAALSRRELAACVGDVDVFARVTPHDKMRIVEALQRNGEVVAVTGDGVNDAPALRQADVGIALADGTPAAVEAADVLLMEDTLAGIVRCVKEGTRLRKRLRSATGFLAAGNLGEIVFMAGAMAFGMPPPLLPSQILLMNVFTDALPTLGLALSHDGDPEHADRHSGRRRRALHRSGGSVFDGRNVRAADACFGTLGLVHGRRDAAPHHHQRHTHRRERFGCVQLRLAAR